MNFKLDMSDPNIIIALEVSSHLIKFLLLIFKLLERNIKHILIKKLTIWYRFYSKANLDSQPQTC